MLRSKSFRPPVLSNVRIVLGLAMLAAVSGCHHEVEPSNVVHTSDPLLGTWVCIADNGGGFKGTTANFRADNTVVFRYRGKTYIRRYVRESGFAWAQRRKAQFPKEPGENERWKEYEQPGIEMVYFQQKDGTFMDYGGQLLELIPQVPLLFNFLTQAWCRPGDEKRVTELMK